MRVAEETGERRRRTAAETCWLGCSEWTIRESDSPHDIRIKRGLIPLVIGLLIALAVTVVLNLGQDKGFVFLVVMLAHGSALIFFLIRGLLGSNMKVSLDVTLAFFVVATLVQDVNNASELGVRAWSYVVLVLDIALVFNAPHTIPFTISVTLVYLLVERVEAGARYGLYEFVSSSRFPATCDCAHPPCGVGVAAGSQWLVFAIILVMDFILTRGFATDLRRQLRHVRSAVDVAAEIAAALARYDIEGAGKAITQGEDLPEELAESYVVLLSNLMSYRDYLPDALLQDETAPDSPRGGGVPPPVGEDGHSEVGMVFTDVQSSTALWEAYPQEMYEALRTHNTTLRGVARAHHGYEVKIIGDALMLAFGSAKDAVAFGVEAQVQLVQSQWSSILCEHPLCQRVEGPDGVPLWHGPRVRIGINWGPVEAERNPVTGRHDFFGTTVNTAARVEAVLQYGGLTGVTQAVVDKVGYDTIGCDMFIAPMGEKDLKGVSQPVAVYAVLPRELAERWRLLEAQEGAVPQFNTPPLSLLKKKSSLRCLRRCTTASSAFSDLSDFSARSLTMTKSQARLNLGLMASDATCVTVRGAFCELDEEDVEVAVTQLLATVETTALRTEGQVVCAVSALCIIGWNAGTRCHDHVAHSAHFVTLVPERLSAHAGAATGHVMSGNISGTRRRHVTVAGGCVELSVSLSESAALHNLHFMAAGEVGAYLGNRGLANSLQRWTESRSARGTRGRRSSSFDQSSSPAPPAQADEKGWEQNNVGQVEVIIWGPIAEELPTGQQVGAGRSYAGSFPE
eukprot:Hpha_TRINITY_DN15800_c6_g9::TRINITY_DN15800_c6_g9_i1::g.187023::m.187023